MDITAARRAKKRSARVSPGSSRATMPQRTNVVADSAAFSENLGGYGEGGTGEYRDQLRLSHVHGEYAVVRSARQLLVFGVKDGALKWKIFNPESSINILAVHDGGIL